MKPVIKDIKISPEKLAELNRILNSGYSKGVKKQAMARIAGRGCVVCGAIPTKIVKYRSDDAFIVERYCLKCYERCVVQRKDKVLLTATNGDRIIAVREREKNYHKGA
jgi:hypothetical protein